MPERLRDPVVDAVLDAFLAVMRARRPDLLWTRDRQADGARRPRGLRESSHAQRTNRNRRRARHRNAD
jgi:hypothetical protein